MVLPIGKRLGVFAHTTMNDFVVMPAFAAANVVAHGRDDTHSRQSRRDIVGNRELAVENRYDSTSCTLAADPDSLSCLQPLPGVQTLDAVRMEVNRTVEDDNIGTPMVADVDPEIGPQIDDGGARCLNREALGALSGVCLK